MSILEVVILVLSILMLIPTLASLTRFDKWWIRGFDFPRIQISSLIIVIFLLNILFLSYQETWHYVIFFLLILSFLYQALKIFPYTPFADKQVHSFYGKDPETTISLLISNVLMSNQNSRKLIDHIDEKQPDIVLTLETNKRWENEMAELEGKYPYTVKIPQDNRYGMHLYSRLELKDIRIKYLVEFDIPSIHGYVVLNNRHRIKIHCVHPKPPSPSEASTSTNRDAELLLVGKDVKKDEESVLVFGDLNDVAWSRTTVLFQKLSGLLDPRIGRGFFNTFHAGHKLLRWPLDHVFHTSDFTLIKLARLKSIGSDHFPIYIKLSYEPRAELVQEEPETTREEREWAEEKIEDGEPREREM